uniref:Putative ovule protein n=1 Tax=Solanum chacoense TaxID=4108 RepID=A0A0V0GSV8_SOLCH
MASLENKMRSKAGWFGQVKRCVNAQVRRYERLAIANFIRGRGRSKKNWEMAYLHLTEDMTLDTKV